MSDAITLRDTLGRHVAPAPSVGRFVVAAHPGVETAALAPAAARLAFTWPAAGEGSVRVLAGPRWSLIGLFDLVVGDPLDAVQAIEREPWREWRGRFAFVAVRDDRSELLAVTDHFATLPLYHSADGGGLLVANTLAPLLRAPWCARRPDPRAIFHYLNFACVPAPHSLVPEVGRLPPASALRWSGGRLQVARWWRPPYAEDLDGDPATLATDLRDHIVATVHRHRPRGDAGWGCFLSGGTDSSSITTILARQHPGEPVHSYSIGFAEAAYDELDFAREAARACGAQGHFGLVDAQETQAILPRLVEIYDQPFGNSSAVPTLACASMAAADSRNVLVAGDGGDEIFGGNERYAKDRLMQAWYRLPGAVRGLGRAIGRRLGGGRSHLLNRVDNFTRRAALPNPDRFYTDDAFASEHFDALLGPALRSALTPGLSLAWMRDAYGASDAHAELHKLMALDLELAIAQNDLVKVDGACRHVGVGARFPYLDPDLVAHTGRLRAHFKLRGGKKRWLFKQAMADVLPASILRKKKQGFGVPINAWIRTDPAFRATMEDLLFSPRSRARGWFQPDYVRRLFDQHLAGAWDHSGHLWQLAMLESWMRHNLDG